MCFLNVNKIVPGGKLCIKKVVVLCGTTTLGFVHSVMEFLTYCS